MPLKAIFFDIDDTLYSTTDFVTHARQKSLEAMIQLGVRYPLPLLLKELQEVIQEFSSNYTQHYQRLLMRLPKSCLGPAPRSLLMAAAVMAYHKAKGEMLRPFPDILPVFKKYLSQKKLILGIISDGLEIKQAEKILRLKIHPYLDPRAIFISDVVGINKPNIKLYQRACREVRVPPGETLYVGDHPQLDIDPANRVGMISVQSVRPSSKYAAVQGQTEPRYRISTFYDLQRLIQRDFQRR